MLRWPEMLDRVVMGNSLSDWLLAALAFLLTFTVLPLLRGFVRSQARRQSEREFPVAIVLVLHLIEHTSRLFRLTVALYAAERILTLPLRIDRLFETLIVFSFWLQVGWWMLAAVRFGLTRRTSGGNNPRLAGTLTIIMFVAQLVVWGVVLLLALDNLGVNITALVAGLGVGGIAIALAVQAILGDLFASLSIALDKPFGVGDLLRVDDCSGTVEQIGIKSTRLRSVTGEQIIISNADVLRSRVRNLGRMSEQRALFPITLRYDTAAEKLAAVPKLVAEAVAECRGARFVYCLLKELGDSGLRYEVVFFAENRAGSELTVALDIVNRGILQRFAAAGIAFAYPTSSVHLSRSVSVR
jgi:small-conductance mechanosensitive channel